MTSSGNTLIYVVDDDHDEHYLLQSVFSRYHKDCVLRCFSNGAELITHLTHCLDGRLPDMILLDLHMPLLNGYEVLQLIKNNGDWQGIPVVIRTLSENDTDIHRCHDLGSHAFLIKTHSYQQLTNSVKAMRHRAFL